MDQDFSLYDLKGGILVGCWFFLMSCSAIGYFMLSCELCGYWKQH